MTENTTPVAAVQDCGRQSCIDCAPFKRGSNVAATQIGFCSYCWDAMPVVTEEDRQIGRTIVSQIQTMTLMGCGFVGFVPRSRAAVLRFRLAGRPYGHREVEVALNGADFYDVTVYRYTRGMKKILVAEYKDIDCEQLDGIVYEGIAKSC